MPTSNINVSKEWTKLADASNTELLVTWHTPVTLEVATTTADGAPVVEGHHLPREAAISRSVIGAGFVWAKLRPGSIQDNIRTIVSK